MQIDGFSFTFQESFLKSYGFTILPCFYHVLLIFFSQNAYFSDAIFKWTD